jgi:hypothetical protein
MSTEPISELSPTSYFWLWLAALGVGLGALVLAHPVAQRLDGSDGDSIWPTAGVLLAAVIALAVVGRSVHVIVTQAFSDAYRVFRSRHLVVCTALLLVVGTFVARAVVTREPFRHVFAHGRIAGADIVDVATVIAALVCLVGAGVAATGAWDARHNERNWHRLLRVPTDRPN